MFEHGGIAPSIFVEPNRSVGTGKAGNPLVGSARRAGATHCFLHRNGGFRGGGQIGGVPHCQPRQTGRLPIKRQLVTYLVGLNSCVKERSNPWAATFFSSILFIVRSHQKSRPHPYRRCYKGLMLIYRAGALA